MLHFPQDEFVFDDRPKQFSQRYLLSKRMFDVLLVLGLAVPFCICSLVLLALNPVLNPGPLFFVQDRMGRGGGAFRAVKFRTMSPAAVLPRGAFDPLERDRISGLGAVLRRCRIDELPQILNVLRGDMSLIGPRPDAFDHARVYSQTVPGYARRYDVLPGITGFAQTEVGYVDGLDGVARKTAADHYYMTHASLGFDLWIVWRTIWVVLGARGC